jgi:phytoene desaturase
MTKRVVIIGAGLGGLSAACHLAGSGHDVTVIEAASIPGGRAGSLASEGFRFDTGPSVLTMPHLIDRCFEAAGVDGSALLTLRPVDPMYRACYADGSELRVRHGREAMTQEIASVCGAREAAAFGRFCDWLSTLYRIEMPTFIERNFDSPLDLARPISPALELVRLGGFRRLAKVVSSYFDDERLRRIFTFQAMYAGLAPYEALAIYAVITYMDSVNGVFIPEGGMHALPVALAAAAEQAGATFRYDTRVDRILLAEGTSGRVTGVRLVDGEVVEAEVVVANPDLPVAYRTLLPGTPMPLMARRGDYSPSAIVWHVGVRGDLPPGTEHHNIHFGQDWDGAFRAILKDGIRMPDPSLLVSVPSLHEPTMAPAGSHAIYVLEPTPNLDGKVDWIAERPRLRDGLLGHLDRLGYPTDIVTEQLLDPLDWEAQGMERGTPFALSHKFRQTGPFRPGNLEKRAPGLVFTGSSTLPGVGVPMVLVSGMLAAQRVEAMGTA